MPVAGQVRNAWGLDAKDCGVNPAAANAGLSGLAAISVMRQAKSPGLPPQFVAAAHRRCCDRLHSTHPINFSLLAV
jgi:hypothetical protein